MRLPSGSPRPGAAAHSRLARMRPMLGTLVEIRASGAEFYVSDGIAAAFAAIERVQRLMSFHDSGSDVARINAAPIGCEVTIDPQTYQVLRYARELGVRSHGAFDIAIAPTLVREGFLPHPSRGGIIAPLTSDDDTPARFSHLELLPECVVCWRNKKAWIDLGGIAKGHAVDTAVVALRSHGIARGLVNAGGDLRGFGEPWPIHLRAPAQPTALLAAGRLCDAAIATSAGYFSGDPIVDPVSGSCVSWNASISVVASTCMIADALTKVVRLAPALLTTLLEHYDAQVVVADEFCLRSCGRERLLRDTSATRLYRDEVAIRCG